MTPRALSFLKFSLAQELPFEVDERALAALYSTEEDLLRALEPYGVLDAELLKRVRDVFTEGLIGEAWPLTLGNWKQHRRTVFFAKLQEKHDAFLKTL